MDTIMDNKIDIHTHVLPGVDDGSKTIQDSLETIEYLKNIGITDIVVTSHYIRNTSYNVNVKEREKILKQLKKKVEDVNLYIGNEVFLCDEVVDLYNKKEICTLNNSKYMLVELPLSTYYNNYPNAICSLNELGIVPIIAHPERYGFIKKDKKRVYELLEYDILLQCNIESLIGKYGKEAKKTAKWLLKKNLVSLVATDTHRVGDLKKINKAYKKLEKIVGKKKYEELVYLNPKRILENQEIESNLNFK